MIIEDQAFSSSSDLAPPSPPLVSKLAFFLSLPVCRRSSFLTDREGGECCVGGAKSYNDEKA
jgi:hypothetical protein